MHFHRHRAAALAVMLFSVTGCVASQEFAQLESRVGNLEATTEASHKTRSDLEARLSALGASGEASGDRIRADYATLRAQVDALLMELQATEGRFEEVAFKQEAVRQERREDREEIAELKGTVMRLKTRVEELRRYVGIESKADAAPGGEVSGKEAAPDDANPAPGATPEPPPPEDSDTLYNAAKQLLDNGELEKARNGFQDILKRFPNSEKADNAQFWIGEIFYRENWFEKAILEYQKVIETYPEGNKVPAALLKQGLAFQKLGQKSNARLILEELIRKYPGSNESVIAQRKLRQF